MMANSRTKSLRHTTTGQPALPALCLVSLVTLVTFPLSYSVPDNKTTTAASRPSPHASVRESAAGVSRTTREITSNGTSKLNVFETFGPKVSTEAASFPDKTTNDTVASLLTKKTGVTLNVTPNLVAFAKSRHKANTEVGMFSDNWVLKQTTRPAGLKNVFAETFPEQRGVVNTSPAYFPTQQGIRNTSARNISTTLGLENTSVKNSSQFGLENTSATNSSRFGLKNNSVTKSPFQFSLGNAASINRPTQSSIGHATSKNIPTQLGLQNTSVTNNPQFGFENTSVAIVSTTLGLENTSVKNSPSRLGNAINTNSPTFGFENNSVTTVSAPLSLENTSVQSSHTQLDLGNAVITSSPIQLGLEKTTVMNTITQTSGSSSVTLAPASWECEDGKFTANTFTSMTGDVAWTSQQTQCTASVFWDIRVPEGNGLVLTFHVLKIYKDHQVSVYGVLNSDNQSDQLHFSSTATQSFFPSPVLVYDNRLFIVVSTSAEYLNIRGNTVVNFTFSDYPNDTLPLRVSADDDIPRESQAVYECANQRVQVPEEFRCDRIKQCVEGEDEANCSYTHEGCGDWVPYVDQCLHVLFKPRKSFFVGVTHVTMPQQAEQACHLEHNAQLAILPDSGGIQMVADMIRKAGYSSATIGLKKMVPAFPKIEHLYRYLWQWGGRGGPVAFNQQKIQQSGTMLDCAMLNLDHEDDEDDVQPLACVLPSHAPDGYVCMRPNILMAQPSYNTASVSFSLTTTPQRDDNVRTKTCPDGSLVQLFHPCAWSDLTLSKSVSLNHFPLFRCRFGPDVHYTLVCNGMEDCVGGDDEAACTAPRLPPLRNTSFTCQNFQVVPTSQRCDGDSDCFDGSDEDFCSSCKSGNVLCQGIGCVSFSFANHFLPSCPAVPLNSWQMYSSGLLHLNGLGWSNFNPLTDNCTDSAFRCRSGGCIPSYMINNGEKDCYHGEDENVPWVNVSCPGFYRCHEYGQCVHPDFVCDGIYHCPNKDDERYCNLLCPDNCTCEGYAYSCHAVFNPHHHLQVRYLDLSGTQNLTSFLQDAYVMEFLKFLNVSYCQLSNVTLTNMPQLIVLDLSHNLLTDLTSLNLTELSGITWLDLSFNPLVPRLDSTFATSLKLAGLTEIETLVLTNTGVTSVTDRALSPLTKLSHLDVRNTKLENYGSEIFWGVSSLRNLLTDDAKLCCPYFHQQTLLDECQAPRDELSSCDDLLQSDFFRVFLWLLSVLAIIGNAGVLLYRLLADERATPPAFRVLVKNLCASDLLMGVYMMMIGVADVRFKGRYVEKEGEWRRSAVCTAAGVLSFVSSEVSAFVICLITLDRLLVICFPLKAAVHLKAKSAILLCCCAWCTCLILATVPLMAGLDFYGQNGICVPLPITRHQFSGQTYAFAVFIVLNFALFALIGVGQIFIFRAVRKTSSAAGTKRGDREITVARRLFLVVFSDFCCWFPIGLMGLLASSGIPIPGEVNVWAAIFVLPLNSALNPFLYTLNGLLNKWEKRRREARTQRMFGKLKNEIPKWQANKVEELMRVCFKSEVVKRERIFKLLGLAPDGELGAARELQLDQGDVTSSGEMTSCVTCDDTILDTSVDCN